VPEGDTVWRTAHRLDQALSGRVLTVSDLRWPSLATVDLRGATTTEVVARGKHVLQRLDSGVTLHSHLRMDGQWRVAATDQVTVGELRQDRIRAVVGTAEWTCIGTRLGMLDLVATADEGTLVGHLGPDLLGPDWDLSTALTNLRRDPRRAIGEALLDQRLLAGIGTLYDSESLFLQRIHPWTPVGELDDSALEHLVERAHQLLQVNAGRAVQSTTGSLRNGETAYVHARSGRPCRRCGSGIRVAMIGQAPQDRTMFYCPACQGGLAPTDDGRPQRPMGSTGGGKQASRTPKGPGGRSSGYRPTR
jgi:endonuclease-8